MGDMSGSRLLEVQDLKMYFKATEGGHGKGYSRAVDGVSFSVEKGQTLGLVGESGCGKTTLGRCILRIYKPTSGRIIYKGQDLAAMTDSQLRPFRRQIQLIFQDPYGSLDPRQNVRAILSEAVAGDREKRTRRETEAEAERYLGLVGLLPSMADRYPHELSGGQRQRVCIARALACRPEMMVCDEPLSALDASIQAQMLNLLGALKERLGLTYIFIAHDIAVVRHIADVIAVMYLGQIVEVIDARHIMIDSVHPYTRFLLAADPLCEAIGPGVLQPMGETSVAGRIPSGCPFHPRCPYADERCRLHRPLLRDIGGGHSVACHIAAAE